MDLPIPSVLPLRASRRAFLTFLGFFLGALCSFAQIEAGSVGGRVTNAGAPLSGAIVTVHSLFLETSTDRDGAFYLGFVPAGTHPVEVSYLGLPRKTVSLTVATGQRAVLDVNLGVTTSETGAEVIALEAFQVSGQRAGQARALNEQRASGSLRSIVSSDAVGRFPDQNTAESMQRITGVSLERDQGEGRFISIRGVDPDLNNTQMNGVSIPASQEDTRKVNLDVFPSDILDSIEVVKAVTPDMDADAIGGSVNIKTQTAFSSDARILRGNLEATYNDLAEKWGYKYGAVWGDKFLDGKVGLLLSFSSAKREFGSDGRETDDAPWTARNGFIVPGGDVQHREYNITRWREGASFSLDFRPDVDSSYYVRGVYSHFSDYENRFRTRFRGAPTRTAPTSNTQGTVTASRIVVDLKDRTEDNNVWTVSGGGENRFSQWTVDYLAAYAHSELDDPFRYQPAFRSPNTTWNYDFSDPKRPTFTGAGLNLAPSAFAFNGWALDKGLNEESEVTLAANFKREIRVGTNDGHVKFGVKYRAKERSVDITSDTVQLASGTLTLADFVRTSPRGVTPTFASINPSAFRAFYLANPTRFRLDVDDSAANAAAEDYDVKENILAAYVMGDATLGKLTLITGVRVEQTDYEANAFGVELVEDDAPVITPLSASRDYTTVLPGVVARYDFSKTFVARGSVTKTLARPKPLDASPSRSIEEGDVTRGNPDLDPYESTNFDLSLELYPQSLGVFSVGVFHKDIKDFIYSEVIVGGGIDGGNLTTPLNGDSASVTGVEADWQQQFTFLPSPFDGLGFYANATLTDSESVLGGARPGEKVPFLNQSKRIYNVALSYEKYGFFIRASLNYRSRYLALLGESSSGDQYVEDHTQLDISTNYKVSKHLTVYAEMLNVTDEPYYAVFNVTNGLRKFEEYSWTANVGVKVTF